MTEILLQENYYEEFLTEKWKGRDIPSGIRRFRLSSHCSFYKRLPVTFIGEDGDIRVKETKLIFKAEGNQWRVYGDPQQEAVYWNRKRMRTDSGEILRGDSILLGEIKIVFFSDYLKIYGEEGKYTSLLEPVEDQELPFLDFPNYRRSPRIIKRLKEDSVEIKSPPEPLKRDKSGLILTVLPSLLAVGITVGIGLLIGRGRYLLMSLGITFTSVIFSIVRFLKDRKEQKETNRFNAVTYEQYLLEKRKELYRRYCWEQETYGYHYPAMPMLFQMVEQYSSRIYERLPSDQDFMTITLGQYEDRVAFPIYLPDQKNFAKTDPLYEAARDLKREYSVLRKEMILSLKRSGLGLVGRREFVHEQLKSYLIQLAIFQSYRDLQIIVIYDEMYQEDFDWIKWLPHCKLQHLNVYGRVYSEKTRDQVLNSVTQILKERKQKFEEKKKETVFLPHFLLIIDEARYILEHSIMEYLNENSTYIGCSFLYSSYLVGNLPDFVHSIVLLDHAKEGELLLKEGEYIKTRIQTNGVQGMDFEAFARNLGVLNHIVGNSSRIPDSVTFSDRYNILKPTELDIEKLWPLNAPEKSLAVPLGIRSEKDVLELNLHEKAHGPHGLIAGTTGSGKSELLQSYILSLAIHFSPLDIGFLLIDYKGGGMSGLFRGLPHLLGTITNLDGSENMRALISIKSELSRRQKIFNDCHVNHIDAYMSLFREGRVTEAIPHLFLMSDEFAELKKEQPEFMKELVSTARIGRSLGVHLLLATQKPSGVVDDQIWSNSRFKIALKVQDETDSREILKNSDAASITVIGRAYLQVGNHEIYELFQSAYSGAPYYEEREKGVSLDTRVYRLNSLGQGVLVNQDLGSFTGKKRASGTQRDAIVEYISNYCREKGNQYSSKVKKPWLPDLPSVIMTPWIREQDSKINYIKEGVVLPIGLLDIPELQIQPVYRINLTHEGGILYIVSGGFGKSFFLITAAVSLAQKYDADEINLYVVDFGNHALVRLMGLPHTAEYITLDNPELYQKFKKVILNEITLRRQKLAKELAQNIYIYNRTASPLPSLIILVDNFDAVREMGFEEEEFFTRISRDGTGLGIYIILTATRVNSIRSATYNNFKNKLAGYNFEKSEILYMVGRSPYELPEIKGRCLVKYDGRVSVLQIFSLSLQEEGMEYQNEVGEIIQNIKKRSQGKEAPHIPLMPDELTLGIMDTLPKDDVDIYAGLETESIKPEGFGISESPVMILGNMGSGKTNLLKVFLHQLMGEYRVTVFDSATRQLEEYGKGKIQIVGTLEEFIQFMDILEEEVISREETLCSNGGKWKTLEKRAILIDDLSAFFSHKTTSKSEIAQMLDRAAKTGIFIVATNLLNTFYGGEPVTDWFKASGYGALLSDQGYLDLAPVHLVPGVQEGVLYRKGDVCVVKISKG